MNKDFPRILTLLREERGLSQKNASAALGISQPLLSHYEKGIRECGLDFVVKAADFYDVSTDYLLGRTADKHPSRPTADEAANESFETNESFTPPRRSKTGRLNALNKKLIFNSLHIVFDILDRIDNKGLSSEAASSISTAVYNVFRAIYSSNPKNSRNLFSVADHIYKSKAHSSILLSNSLVDNIAGGLPIEEYKSLDRTERPELSPNIIENDYPEYSSSLFNLIQNTEQRMNSIHI